MAKASIKPSNGLIPIQNFQVPLTNVVPPRPRQHAMLMNPLGLNPIRSRVVAALAAASLPAASKPNG